MKENTSHWCCLGDCRGPVAIKVDYNVQTVITATFPADRSHDGLNLAAAAETSENSDDCYTVDAWGIPLAGPRRRTLAESM